MPVRRELDQGVEAGGQRRLVPSRLAGDEKRIPGARRRGAAPPQGDRLRQVRDQGRLVDEEQRTAVDADVARVAEQADERVEQALAVARVVALLHQHVAVQPVPSARPVLVRPAHAEGKVRRAARDHVLERALEQAPAVEPVEVVAEAVQAVRARERGLGVGDARVRQVVVAERPGHAGLLVPGEERLRAAHVRPLGEALAPPAVVFGDAVVLGQVERDRAYRDAVRASRSSRAHGSLPR